MIFRTFAVLLAMFYFLSANAQQNTDTITTEKPGKAIGEVPDTFLKKNIDSTAIQSIEKKQAPTDAIVKKSNETTLVVEVYERNTIQTVDGVEVYLYEMPDKKYVETQISSNGTASFIIDKNIPYEIRTCKNGFLKKGMSIFDCNRADKLFCLRGVLEFYHGLPHTLENQLLAKIAINPIAVGQTMELENVYYDLGKSSLRKDSKAELDKLYNMLKQYTTLKIEVSSHTDSRGGNDFNLKLSANRAKACFTYLVDKGIAPERVIHQGYGETMLLNECEDGTKCKESEHQINRRTEISILELIEVPCSPEDL